jgi:4-amino-4-deoxy-L-arabinose transferase-like glycosyltransferase
LNQSFFRTALLLVIALNILATFGAIMGTDAALYADIAKNIVWRNDWINLYGHGKEFLDKPHLPFWLSAACYKVFGINAFAYKLPNFLAFLLAGWYTYRLAEKLYNRPVARLAVLIWATALHLVICLFDVRAEVLMACFTIGAVYHLYCAGQPRGWLKHIAAGALFAACAVMTKGIFVLITIAGGFFLYWLFSGQWKQLLQPKWWLAVVLTGIFILPELICLYLQFDLHPEKVVFGTTHVSGLKFFFWDSQFGRFFNTGPIKGKGDVSFFLHTTLWAFLPWSLFLFVACFRLMRNTRNADRRQPVQVIYWACAITFLVFSLSKFQLPHYIVLLFPFLAIITAHYLPGLQPAWLRGYLVTQKAVAATGFLLLATVAWFYRFGGWVLFCGILVVLLLLVLLRFRPATLANIVGVSLCFFAAAAIFLNIFFYPDLVNYQGGKIAGQFLQHQKKAYRHYIMYRCDSYTFEFYAPGLVVWESEPQQLQQYARESTVIFMPAVDTASLAADYQLRVLKVVDDFHITLLTGEFINRQTRPATLQQMILAEVQPKRR